jgi:hypothetical protein
LGSHKYATSHLFAGWFFVAMKINLNNIESLQSEKAIKSLAFGLLIKEIYVSSAVKNYNPHSLQKKLAKKGFNFHHSTIKKYVNILLTYNLAEIINGCLIVKRLHTHKTAKIRIKKGYAKSFKAYIHFIRGGMIKRKIWKAGYVYKKRCLSVELMKNPDSPDEFRTGKRMFERYGAVKIDETGFNYKQSIHSLCNEFNCSVGELYSTIKFLVSNGWLIVDRNFTKLCKYFGGDITIPNSFVKDGYLFVVECNTYSLLNFYPFMNNDSKK